MLINNFTAKSFFALIPLLFTVCISSFAATPATLFEDSFESSTIDILTVGANNTSAQARLVPGGHLSPQCLEVDKEDTTGILTLSHAVDVSGGHTVQITADLKSLFVGPFAEYFLWAQQLGADGKIITQQGFAFDDGFAVASAFGGAYKTPQTLGEWKTTRNMLSLDAKTTRLNLIFSFKGGAQKMLVDNIHVDDFGTGKPETTALPFYQKDLNVASASLDLDTLVPGFTYEITAVMIHHACIYRGAFL